MDPKAAAWGSGEAWGLPWGGPMEQGRRGVLIPETENISAVHKVS